jgi:hypothetical protein
MAKPSGMTHRLPQLHEAALVCVIGLAGLGANAALAFWTVGSVVRSQKRLVQTSELSAAVSQAVAAGCEFRAGGLSSEIKAGPGSEGLRAAAIGSYGTAQALSRASLKLPGDLRAKIVRLQGGLRTLKRAENGSLPPPARPRAEGGGDQGKRLTPAGVTPEVTGVS